MEALARQDSASDADKETENLPPECGVERMNNNNYDAELWEVLARRSMGNLSQFHQQGFFDEAPLYTRESDVDFLKGNEKANEILLRFALKFLNSVIAYEQHSKGYFAAITLWDFPDDRLVPNIFAWCRPVRELEAQLALSESATRFGKRIKKLVGKLKLPEHFSVLEDTDTDPSATRVFVGPMTSPYRGFLTLDSCHRAAPTSK